MIKISKEIQIGLVAVVGVVVLYFGLQFLKGLTVFSSDSKYFVKFDNITGLSASSPVYANGFRVGVVEDIIYDYEHQDHIVAVVGLNKEMRLPKGSTAEIVSDLLGNIDGYGCQYGASDSEDAAEAGLYPGKRQHPLI